MSAGAIIFWTGCLAIGLGVIGGVISLAIIAYADARRMKASTFNDVDPDPAEFNIFGRER